MLGRSIATAQAEMMPRSFWYPNLALEVSGPVALQQGFVKGFLGRAIPLG